MVYRRGTLKVLLGPEHLQGDEYFDTTDYSPDTSIVQIKPQPRKSVEPFRGYGKIGETNVYKRTRPFQAVPQRPRLDRYPSGLELSGQRVEKGEDRPKHVNSARSTLSTTSGQRNRDLDSQPDANKSDETENKSQKESELKSNTAMDSSDHKAGLKTRNGRQSAANNNNNSVSKYFLTDFGLRSERTDTFSGHHRRRGVASADLERQMEEKAERHIRTCQVMGNVKRSSKAQFGYQGLKLAVSPRPTPSAFYATDSARHPGMTPRDFYRSEENLNKTDNVSYMIQIRKSLGSFSKTRAIGQAYKRHDPLPAITCQTMMVGSGIGV